LWVLAVADRAAARPCRSAGRDGATQLEARVATGGDEQL
jgi:hypothetical protein